ncbi:MAG: methyltransferase [Parcubacteria group bacterium Gr01-1014_48]|nr:MAG: methyltransferase [Parcubacteria group bacterium Greene0416_14]TSC72815.1 MAG: methyltransferase [Parcubacteria group bacterium Gr01-1014_48]TSC99692.1 MAG: methyltransferase [Parcubacteria group bacterium Greene1014_15]TSD07746.1 MAG: methyltransferase [Parcubacteria group bacterium Greene0714_4]
MKSLAFTDDAHTKALKETYDLIAGGYAKEHEHDRWGYDVLDEMFSTVSYKGIVFDIGCGPGKECAYAYTKGYRVIGADISPGMLEQARLRVPLVPFFSMNVLQLVFAENSLDAVIARSVLLHVPQKDVPQALREIRRVLVPGGRAYIAIRNGAGERMITETYYGHTYSRFFSYFSMEEFSSLCKDAGLLIEKIRCIEPVDKDRVQYLVKKQ